MKNFFCEGVNTEEVNTDMTRYLPPSLLALFAPRPPITFKPPMKRPKHGPITGLAQYTAEFENPADVDYTLYTTAMTRTGLRTQLKKQKAERRQKEIDEQIKQWNPSNNTKATGDPFKTLFVARLPYETTERDLEKEFDVYGKIKSIKIVEKEDGSRTGYAFIEYESEKDMKKAYKEADGTRVRGRRALVDVERGRIIKGWRPRRYGGGLGRTREDKEKKKKESRKRERSRSRDRDRDRHRGGHGDRDRYRDRDRGRRY